MHKMKWLQVALVKIVLAGAVVDLSARVLPHPPGVLPLPLCESGSSAASGMSVRPSPCLASPSKPPDKSGYKEPPEQPSGFVQTLQRTPEQQRRVDQLLLSLRNLAARPLTIQSLRHTFPWVRVDPKRLSGGGTIDLTPKGSDDPDIYGITIHINAHEISWVTISFSGDHKQGSCVTTDDVFKTLPFKFLYAGIRHWYDVKKAVKDFDFSIQTEVIRNADLFGDSLWFSTKHTKLSNNLNLYLGMIPCVMYFNMSEM
jgi:hypothetical protein